MEWNDLAKAMKASDGKKAMKASDGKKNNPTLTVTNHKIHSSVAVAL